jgi:NAD+ synthase (glutamine-hydrolysing)
MPSKFNSDLTKNAAKKLSENIGCNYVVTPIEDAVLLTKSQITHLGRGIHLTPFMLENVQARDRSSRVLAAWSASFEGVFTCNANKSEMTVGYTTLYGDLSGFLAPISDLWKTQVYEMARWFNTNVKNIIPKESIDVVPSAELSENQDVTKGKGDPINYAYHDLLFSSWVERWNRATPEDILTWLMNGTLEEELGWTNEFRIMDIFDNDIKKFVNDLERWWGCYQGLSVAKRIQSPPVIAVSRRSFGFDHREAQVGVTYTDKYLELKEKLME